MCYGHELEDLLRRVAAFCLVPEAVQLRGVSQPWNVAFRCAPPMCAWYVQLARQRGLYQVVAAIAQTAVFPCTRALAASSKEVWRIFTMAYSQWSGGYSQWHNAWHNASHWIGTRTSGFSVISSRWTAGTLTSFTRAWSRAARCSEVFGASSPGALRACCRVHDALRGATSAGRKPSTKSIS